MTARLWRLYNRLTDTGLDRGLKGNGLWLAVGIVGVGGRVLRRRWGRDEIVFRQVLGPGEQLVIDHTTETFAELARRGVTADR